MNFKKLFIITLIALLLAGCSTPQDNTSEGQAVLRVGMECNYAPFN